MCGYCALKALRWRSTTRCRIGCNTGYITDPITDCITDCSIGCRTDYSTDLDTHLNTHGSPPQCAIAAPSVRYRRPIADAPLAH